MRIGNCARLKQVAHLCASDLVNNGLAERTFSRLDRMPSMSALGLSSEDISITEHDAFMRLMGSSIIDQRW